MQKQLGFVLKTIWFVMGLLAPTSILLASYYFRYLNRFIHFSTPTLFAIYYFPAILLIIVFACIYLFIWRKPYSLFALSFGFLITPVSYHTALFFLGGWHWSNANDGFGGLEMGVVVMGMFFSIPLAIISLIPVILKWYRRKKPHQPVDSIAGNDASTSV